VSGIKCSAICVGWERKNNRCRINLEYNAVRELRVLLDRIAAVPPTSVHGDPALSNLARIALCKGPEEEFKANTNFRGHQNQKQVKDLVERWQSMIDQKYGRGYDSGYSSASVSPSPRREQSTSQGYYQPQSARPVHQDQPAYTLLREPSYHDGLISRQQAPPLPSPMHYASQRSLTSNMPPMNYTSQRSFTSDRPPLYGSQRSFTSSQPPLYGSQRPITSDVPPYFPGAAELPGSLYYPPTGAQHYESPRRKRGLLRRLFRR
jgi:hypothetical protein